MLWCLPTGIQWRSRHTLAIANEEGGGRWRGDLEKGQAGERERGAGGGREGEREGGLFKERERERQTDRDRDNS